MGVRKKDLEAGFVHMSALSCLGVSPRDMASATPTKVHDKLKKGSMDQDEMRRKREATTMQIRKDKKEESIQKSH